MKILCFIDSLASGGAQRQMAGLAGLLKDNNYQVKVITYHNITFYKHLLDAKEVEFEYISHANNRWFRIFHISKAFRSYRPDVVIAFLDPCAMMSSIIKIFIGNFKLIVSERNTTQKLNLKQKIKFFLFRNADFIVPNSYSQNDFIKINFSTLHSRTITITNFVDTNIFSPTNRLSIKDSPLQMICVGRVTEQKNILRFLSGLRIAIDLGVVIHVRWFGEKFEYYQKCKEKIKELDLNNHIDFMGLSKEISNEYRYADVFCLPSIYEGFPNVVCEAMSCGLPVLCSNVSDNSQIVRDGINGLLFNPLDEDDIANKIHSFAKMSLNERFIMGQNSRIFATSDFSPENFVRKYIKLIES